MAETRPPSWPISSDLRVGRPGQDDVLADARTSRRRSRSRPKRNESTSVSHVRKRGHARVQHACSPVARGVQSAAPPSSSRWNGR